MTTLTSPAPEVPERHFTAFEESRRIAGGPLHEVARAVKVLADKNGGKTILVFDDATSELIELDLRGTSDDVLDRLHPLSQAPEPQAESEPTADTPRGPGRPKLGVVAREVTLLPRHWDWLSGQPGGASVALRKLVEEARRSHENKDRIRRAQESGYRFMSTIAGHQPGFEEASRALFAGDAIRFDSQTAAWPRDVRDHVRKLLALAFEAPAPAA